MSDRDYVPYDPLDSRSGAMFQDFYFDPGTPWWKAPDFSQCEKAPPDLEWSLGGEPPPTSDASPS